jgi:thiol-disulfide isomerase/thioredoxin
VTGPRVRAPQFPAGATWFNVAEPPALADLRGRFVLLDFWTFCCGNCLHVIDELRPLEHKYADVLTVIGVHSPKFDHEKSDVAVRAAIERYEVAHPVVNDPAMALWQQYAVHAWPTLVLIDPEGYVVAQAAGEGQASALDATIEVLRAQHEARGTLRSGAAAYAPPAPEPSELRFPAKAIRHQNHLLVADAGHHQIVELDLDGQTVVRRIGDGRGRPFAEPNGLTLLPPGIAPYDLVVADTANHVLRGIRLVDGAVVATIDLPAGLADARTITGPIPAVLSPWDVVWWPALDRLAVAAAGVHLLLAVDPRTDAVEVLAGTTVEGLRDGPALDGWLAQPSALAVDGDTLWFVDSETSALRRLTLSGELHTAVGQGLFDFGHVDGPAQSALFQHPLGVTVLPDHSVAVLDTYNGAVRRYDPVTDTVATLATDLAEPSGAVLIGDDLVVVESAAHRLVRPVPRSELVARPPMHTERPVSTVAPGAVTLSVRFAPAPGRALDERYGPATRLTVSASPAQLLASGAGESAQLTRELLLTDGIGEGVLHVTAQAASCDKDGEHPACYLARQDWGVPIRVAADGDHSLDLVLLG